ncbi:MAG TPA: nuclear transport factor 2 family protein [Pyrinomonadaceae bacterium]|nr:nuclear transport factor 2 family protein [Pyrinomonadaceae bacterium]
MRKILILAALLVLASPAFTRGQTAANKPTAGGKSEREILKFIDDWIDALKRNDGAALERMVADDFHIVLSDGQTRDKEQELAPSKSGEIKFDHLSAEDVKIFVSGDTAIATGVGIFRGTSKGRAFDGRERFFDVYQKRNGRWLILASRSTPAPAPKPAP